MIASSSLPLALTLLVLGTTPPLRGQDPVATTEAKATTLPAARAVVDRYLAASGRAAHLAEVRSIQSEGTLVIEGRALEGTIRTLQSRPNKYLNVATITAYGETRQGYDGKVGWVEQAGTGSVLEKEPLMQLRGEASFDGQLYGPEHVASMEVLGSKTFAGQECYEVRIELAPTPEDAAEGLDPEQTKPFRESLQYFSIEDGLLVGSTARQATPTEAVTVTSTLSDYKEFGGILFPTRMVQEFQGNKVVVTYHTVSLEPVADEAFALPPKIQALLPKPGAEGGGDR